MSAPAATPAAATPSGSALSRYVPAQLERHLQFIQFHPDGHLLLGCSNLTDRYWVGSLWLYPPSALEGSSSLGTPTRDRCLTGLDCDNGVVQAVVMPDDTQDQQKQFVVAMDNGALDHLTLTFSPEEDGPSFHYLQRLTSVQEHDDLITSLSRTCDGSGLVTTSYDRSIVQWDAAKLKRKATIARAHGDVILAGAASPHSPDMAATVGQDGVLATWDLRQSDKAASLHRCAVTPSAVEYVPKEEHLLLLGNAAGEIELRDLRNSGAPLTADRSSFDQAVHAFSFSAKRPELFAACADETAVRVFEINSTKDGFTQTYADSRHTDYVRGLTWHPTEDSLWTCSWDKTVLRHSV